MPPRAPAVDACATAPRRLLQAPCNRPVRRRAAARRVQIAQQPVRRQRLRAVRVEPGLLRRLAIASRRGRCTRRATCRRCADHRAAAPTAARRGRASRYRARPRTAASRARSRRRRTDRRQCGIRSRAPRAAGAAHRRRRDSRRRSARDAGASARCRGAPQQHVVRGRIVAGIGKHRVSPVVDTASTQTPRPSRPMRNGGCCTGTNRRTGLHARHAALSFLSRPAGVGDLSRPGRTGVVT